jgi:hypothetical protein
MEEALDDERKRVHSEIKQKYFNEEKPNAFSKD